MQIAPQAVVTLNFAMRDAEGNVLDQSNDASFSYLHGAGRILPGLERRLEGKRAGDKLEFDVPPAEAFGERDENLTELAPPGLFKMKVKPGMQFQARTKDGSILPMKIVKVEGDDIHIDANHPLAGMTLHFAVEILDVRKATAQETAAGTLTPAD